MQNKKNILSQCLLFDGLPEEQLEALAAIVSQQKYRKGATIFQEAEPCQGFYIALSGKVKIYKTSMGGKEQILHIFGRGEPFGEVPVFHGNPYPATAEALTDIEVYFFPRRAFVGLLEANPSLALNMLAILASRLRHFATQIEHLSLKEVPGRLASYLIYLMKEQKNSEEVVLDIPKGQLASLLGTSPETLSRIFLKMSEEGLIQVSGRKIVLLNQEGLQER